MADGRAGPHRAMINRSTHEDFAALNAARPNSAILIAGAYNRPLNVRHGSFLVETEQETITFDLQTPSVFVDIRIPRDRPAIRSGSLEELSLLELQALSKQHCFAGHSAIRYNTPGYEGHPICDRLYAHVLCSARY
eukprot:SAG31_NODE_18851_length_620_cov_1.126679_1_plen_136_part_00